MVVSALDQGPDAGSWKEEELETIEQVKAALAEDKDVDLSLVEEEVIVLCTMVGKQRVEKAVESVKKYLSVKERFGVPMLFKEGWQEELKKLAPHLEKYAVCGRDQGGRNVMWINPDGGIEIADEGSAMTAGCYFMIAMNSDMHTMRHGSSMVMDANVPDRKIGNEKKLQKAWSDFPNRPQHIIIINASTLKRVFINAMVKFVSVFSSNKIFQRLRFGNMEDVVERCMPEDSLPSTHGGPDRGTALDWVSARITAFPMPGKADAAVGALTAEVAKVKLPPKVLAM